MATLAHAAYRFRRTLRVSYGYVASIAALPLILQRSFAEDAAELSWIELLVAGLVSAAFIGRAAALSRARAENQEKHEKSASLELEFGLLSLILAYGLIHAFGDLYQPGLYLLIALLAAFLERRVAALLTLIAIGIDYGVHTIADGSDDLRPFAVRATFILGFSLSSVLFTRVEIARIRASGRRFLAEERARVAEEGRLLRNLSPSAEGEGDQERLFHASVEEVRHALYPLLRLIKASLDLHTLALLRFNEEKFELRVSEAASDSDDLAEGPLPAGGGVVGAVLKRGEKMSLANLKPGYQGLIYYEGPALVRAFTGIPVVDNGKIIGVLVADRLVDRPFTAGDEALLAEAVEQILRTIRNERLLLSLERSKRQQSTLFQASRELGTDNSYSAVVEGGLKAVRTIVSYDFAAFTSYDEERKKHRIDHIAGDLHQSLVGLEFRDNNSLTAMAVKNQHFLPYRGHHDPVTHVVFTKRAKLTAELRSLLILPLVWDKKSKGTLILGSRKANQFPESIREMLQVITKPLVASLENAKAVRRLEELATTDGLTGCLNKRAFLEELDKSLRSAERFGRRLSLLVTDIDHFKSVNDTYGHATGDVVIKELGAVLTRVKRETDIVARFGGEEFCVLCEETDIEGARQLAERVREEFGSTVFRTEHGELRVTLSVGVATFPIHAANGDGLFEAADKALYVAKNKGRNCVAIAA